MLTRAHAMCFWVDGSGVGGGVQVASRRDLQNKMPHRRNMDAEIAQLELRYTEAVAEMEQRRMRQQVGSQVEVILQPKDVHIRQDSSAMIHPWYTLPRNLEGQTAVKMLSATLKFKWASKASSPHIRARSSEGHPWASLGDANVISRADMMEVDIPARFIGSGLELGVANTEESDVVITGATLTVTIGPDHVEEDAVAAAPKIANAADPSYSGYPFKTRQVKCQRPALLPPWPIVFSELTPENGVS